MRGTDYQQSQMFSYLSPEQRVRKDHPLRAVRAMVDEVLRLLSPQFSRMYAREGRPSIAPEKLLLSLVVQMLYSIRSERRVCWKEAPIQQTKDQANRTPSLLFGDSGWDEFE